MNWFVIGIGAAISLCLLTIIGFLGAIAGGNMCAQFGN